MAQTARRVVGLEPGQPEYRILAVDDRLESRLLLVKMLSSLGFAVEEAENGVQAVEMWSSWEPHLIWMDMRMPVMDGYEATKQIKAHLKGQATVIIALTASAFDEERSVILSAGCDDFVAKPFREQVILEKMAKYLGVRYVYDQEPSATSQSNRFSSALFGGEIAGSMPLRRSATDAAAAPKGDSIPAPGTIRSALRNRSFRTLWAGSFGATRLQYM